MSAGTVLGTFYLGGMGGQIHILPYKQSGTIGWHVVYQEIVCHERLPDSR